MDSLIKAGYMQWQGSLRATYNKYLHPDVLDYETPEMWDWVAENKVTNLFQFDTQTGLQAAKRIKPHSLPELAAANSVMRLMVSEEGAEQPIDTYIRFKNDISQWYSLMRDKYRLTDEEIKTVEPYLLPTYGVGDTQEIVMELSMDDHISGFNVAQSNKLRKGISKKDRNLQQNMKTMFFEHGKEIGTSDNLLNYIWKEVVGKQLGYSFSKNHTVPYSIIGLQELNLAYHYPIIFWNTACLIVDAGADEQIEENKSTDYGKIATAISNMQKRGVDIALPLINSTDFGFIPDEERRTIIYSVKAINGIGDDVARDLIQNRPYSSMEDFCSRMLDTGKIKTSQMVQLIKAGCFTELDQEDRRLTMKDFLVRYVLSPIEKLTMSQFDRLVDFDGEFHFIPQNIKEAMRHKFFKDYVLQDEFFYKNYIDPTKRLPKAGYNDRWYRLDDVAMPFFQSNYSEDSIEAVDEQYYIISEKKLKKENDKYLEKLKEWMKDENTIAKYNECLFKRIWQQYASGSVAKWEMDSLSVYCTQEHELANLKKEEYGVVNFFEEPEEPQAYDYYIRYIGEGDHMVKKEFPKNKIVRIAGTVLDKNKDRHLLTLLTLEGVVNVKFDKGQFAYYDRQEQNEETGKKDKSWFTRGNKLLICGFRRGDQFVARKYADTVWKHTCNLIIKVFENGRVSTKLERG